MGNRNYQETLVGFILIAAFNLLWWVITIIPDELVEEIHIKLPVNFRRVVEVPKELIEETALIEDTTLIEPETIPEDFSISGDGKTAEGIALVNYEPFPGVIWGVDNSGVVHKTPFQKLRHTCIYGTTGVGKDILLKMILTNIIYGKPEAQKFMIVDGKGVDYSLFLRYNLPHNIGSFIVGVNCENQSEALERGLEQLNSIMRKRQDLFNRAEVTDIRSFELATNYVLPRILFIVTDVDSNVDKKVMAKFAELVKKVRAFGIVVIFSTQNPKSVDTTLRAQMTFMMVGRQGSQRQSSMATGKSLNDYEATPPHSLPQEPGLFWFSDSAEEFIIRTPVFKEGLFLDVVKKFAVKKTKQLTLNDATKEEQDKLTNLYRAHQKGINPIINDPRTKELFDLMLSGGA